MRRLKASDLGFTFANPDGLGPFDRHRFNCGLCGTRFYDHGLPVFLDGHVWGTTCGECLRSETKRLAVISRDRAALIRTKRPPRGYDADTNIRWSEDLLRFAAIFDMVNSLDAIPGGTLARKIGEGYRELDDRKRTRKAA